MKNKFTLALILFLIFHHQVILAQQEVPIKDPKAEAFTIFGDIPVSHTNGVPDISIPLFNLKSHGYNLPITLRYHQALVKPPFDQTNVATGWMLEVGGNITQQIKGVDDLKDKRPESWKTESNLHDQYDQDVINYISLIDSDIYDTEYDFFSYSLPGKNGKFVIEKNTQDYFDFNFLSEPLFKGETTGSVYDNPELRFNIIDDSGYKYVYSNDLKYYENKSKARTRFLEKILTPSGDELFSFEYLKGSIPNISYPKKAIYHHYTAPYIGADASTNNSICNGYYTPYDISFSDELDHFGQMITIKKVIFEGGVVEFNIVNNIYIDEVSLYDNDHNLIKRYDFIFGTFFGLGNQYLDKIIIKDKTNQEISNYDFTYNGSALNSKDIVSTDYWGYLNGQNSANNSFNFIDIEPRTVEYDDCNNHEININLGSGNKDPVFFYANSCVLNSIKYPTGGKTEFTFELNRLDFPLKYYGGLRIKNIINYDSDNAVARKVAYEYQGELLTDPLAVDIYDYTMTVNYYGYGQSGSGLPDGYCFMYTHNDDMKTALGTYSPYYTKVTEYIESTINNQDNGKIEYKYSYDNPNALMSLLFRSQLVSAHNNRVFNNPNYKIDFAYILEHRDWGNGLLNKKSIFKRNGAIYDKVLEEEYGYDYQVGQSFDNLGLLSTVSGVSETLYDYLMRRVLLNTTATSANAYGLTWNPYDIPYIDPVVPYDYTIKAGTYKLKSKITREFLVGSILESEETYHYGNGLLNQLTSVETNTSASTEKNVSKLSYPTDYSIEPYISMVDKNMVSPVIQSSQYIKENGVETFLSTSKTNYKEWYTDLIKPLSVQTSKEAIDNAFEEDIQFHSYYDNGNLKEISKKDGAHTVYIWGYHDEYPIAKIENVTYSQVSSQVINIQALSDLDNDRTVDIINTDGSISKIGKEGDLREALRNLRSSLPNALVTTYTYDILVGITSVTDPKGYTMYYQYDDFNRLKQVKDADGKILSQNEYHYKGEQ
ncbi:RHS repeat domain-containing protein [Flavivirga amylovorans]|uniref:RHS repeat domain-containing protein n=1 Tax=Flavivirga amylovorans TaxID=870486 RepID=A0ABT8WY67_9FLAO|nr:RHS repeat domain-containing protein [Flavivirga amylovorans]MDO5986290.1 RHS repeat domain-containing protein [Flavivirga amylovorans]